MRECRLGWPARLVAIGVLAAAGSACADPAANRRVCGELSRVGEFRVLRVWGTAAERGYAHGWLLAEDIKRLFESFLADKAFSGGVKNYCSMTRPMAESLLSPRPIYRREMEGIVAGYRDRLGEGANIAGLDRPLEYGDIVVINCLSDRIGPMCSSFAVWGSLTPDGGTLTARNLDWPRHSWMIGADLVLVQLPSEKPMRAGWASLTWPGFVGCLSGMNGAGVTAAMHDVPVGAPEGMIGFVPRGLVLREALEKSAGAGAIQQVAALFRTRRIAVGTNIFVSEPWEAGQKEAAAAVMEYDGATSKNAGVTVRGPASSGADRVACFLACTNHFRERGELTDGGPSCPRYAKLQSVLSEACEKKDKLDADEVWRIAASVNVPGTDGAMLTYHTIVFEPNRRVMLVARADAMEPAGRRKPVQLELSKLLAAGPKAAAGAGR